MNPVQSSQFNRGAVTLIVAMIMLVLATMLVASAFKLSSTNLVAVGNVQSRAGALAAAEKVIGLVIRQDVAIATLQETRTESVDINRDGIDDYRVDVPPPLCVRATPAVGVSANSVTLAGFSLAGGWNTLWEINAIATDEVSGASVSVVQGVRYLLSDAEKRLVCD